MVRLFPLALAAPMVAVWPSAAAAKHGFYMILGAAFGTIEGDFDGETLFVAHDDSEAIIVPEIDPGVGPGRADPHQP